MEEKKPIIMILMPVGGSVEYEAFASLSQLFMNIISNGYGIRLVTTCRRPHALARNELLDKAIKVIESEPNITDVVWIDDDHTFDKDIVFKLKYVMEEFNLDVLSASYLTRSLEPKVCALKVASTTKNNTTKIPTKYTLMNKYEPDTLYEVDAVGFGMVMMKPKVLQKLYKRNKVPFAFVPRDGDHLMGEDILGCEEIRKCGFKIYVHTGIWLGHLITMNLQPDTAQVIYDMRTAENEEMIKNGKKHKSEGKRKRKPSKGTNGNKGLRGRKTKTKV